MVKTLKQLFIFFFFSFAPASSSLSSIDSFFLHNVHKNIQNVPVFSTFYARLLKEVRHYGPIDTAQSLMNLSLIETRAYNETQFSSSCYANGFDMLRAHNVFYTNLSISSSGIQAVLPALLYSVENPGCVKQPLPQQRGTFSDVWLLGVVLLLCTKFIHLLSIFLIDDKSSWQISNTDTSMNDNLDESVKSNLCRFSGRYRLWVYLGFVAFTCGLLLGTIIYHLIPQTYEIPNENLDYTYLWRTTMIFGGLYLFFIVEKLLRFRFAVDVDPSVETSKNMGEISVSSNVENSQTTEMDERLSMVNKNVGGDRDADDAEHSMLKHYSLTGNDTNNHHHHPQSSNDRKIRASTLIFCGLTDTLLYDSIYGSCLGTAFAQDRLIGGVLWITILMEGLQRHLQNTSSLDRKRKICLGLISTIVVLSGFALGGILFNLCEPLEERPMPIPPQYIYSITCGALFYSTLLILMPKLHALDQKLQLVAKSSNQTPGQQQRMKIYVLLCQNVFLLLGFLLPLIVALLWRQLHRRQIHAFVCARDSLHPLCD